MAFLSCWVIQVWCILVLHFPCIDSTSSHIGYVAAIVSSPCDSSSPMSNGSFSSVGTLVSIGNFVSLVTAPEAPPPFVVSASMSCVSSQIYPSSFSSSVFSSDPSSFTSGMSLYVFSSRVVLSGGSS